MSLPWLSDPRRPLTSPREIPKLEAWFDALDTRTMLSGDGSTITDGGAVALWGDKSGNSGTLCYVSNVAASNSVSSPNKSVTGNQTFTLDVGLDDYSPASDLTIVSKLSGNDGFAILLLTTGVVRLRVGDGASVTNVDSTAAVANVNLARRTIGIAWTDGVGASFTQDGAALGTAVAAVKTLTNAAVVCTIGTITGRIYRVQVGSVYDFNPSGTTAKKLANGDTLTAGGDVWTLASSGATGARIAGERDLYQGTLANRPVYGATLRDVTFDGSNDYLKAPAFALAQPETVYIVGKQVSWTQNDTLYDGNAAANRMAIYQNTGTPSLSQYGGTTGANPISPSLGVNAVLTAVFSGASSLQRLNRGTASTAATNIGTHSANGFTLGAYVDGTTAANITVLEVLIFAAAHDKATQDRVIAYLGRRHGIAV